jgi:hypothetical protein
MRKLVYLLALDLLAAAPEAGAQADKIILLPQDTSRHLAPPGMMGPPAPVHMVLRTAAEWDSVWQAVTRTQVYPPAPPAPMVDFNQEIVLLVGLGRQPSTGWNVRIDTVVTRRDTLRVVIHSVAPQCTAGMMITYPWDAVRVPRTNAAIQFIKRPIVDHCR